MDTAHHPSPSTDMEKPDYSFFLDNIEYHKNKGRGFSVFGSNDHVVNSFLEQCSAKGINNQTIKLSEVDKTFKKTNPNSIDVIIQDLNQDAFLEKAPIIADRLIFPFWFNRLPLCFFSSLGRGGYETKTVNIKNLHENYSMLINSLQHEQIFNLLDRVNCQFSSPDFINLSKDKTVFTPIEEIMLKALEDHNLSYKPQVRMGQFTVDFLVGVHGKKVIVECDGKAYHDPIKDRERDKVLSSEGFPICRFSGADIYSDVHQCVDKIEQTQTRRIFPTHLLDEDLDQSQVLAVNSMNGPTRVLAPAGSGKTKTLINRTLHLLNQGIPAEKILALAFNKKAKDEMQERLDRKRVNGVEVRTFHSLGYEIVKNKEAFGWTFNGRTYKKTMKGLMKEAIRQHTELPPMRNKDPLDAFFDGLRKAKMELPALSTVTVEYAEHVYPFEDIFYSYLEKQIGANFLDFDDMIYLALRALLDNKSLRRIYQSRFEFVLVDEFQDLNQAQLLLLQILALPENNIFAVGDDDQMIYGFRGADVRHIIEFDKRFPISSNHTLNTNYRSSKMIVRHSGWLIDQNEDRVKKDIQPRMGAPLGRFEISGHNSLFEQAEHSVKWLVAHKNENKRNWRDYAILYRYNAFQFPLAVILDNLNVPHSPLSGQHLFQSAVGIDIYSYLHIALSPNEASSPDYDRILKRPNKYFTNQLISQAQNWRSFVQLADAPNLRDWEGQKLTDFIRRMERLSNYANTPNISAIDCMQILKTEFGLAEFYRDQSRKSDDLDQASDEIIMEVITALAQNFKTIKEFYQHICKSIDDNADMAANRDSMENMSNKNEVFLSTIHKAKGKEFDNVIFFNLNKMDAQFKEIQAEEERRVVYVGATRPKDNLFITYSINNPSSYLMELCLNPIYKDIRGNVLLQRLSEIQKQLETEKFNISQIEFGKHKASDEREILANSDIYKLPKWVLWFIKGIQDRRVERAIEKVERFEQKLTNAIEKNMKPILYEINQIDEEIRMRKCLKIN